MNAIWVCPRCRGALTSTSDPWTCTRCHAAYQLIGGVPDLRIAGPAWIEFEDDLQLARKLAGDPSSGADLVRRIFRERRNWTEELVERRSSQVLEAPRRLQGEIDRWLREPLSGTRRFIDVGCGPGGLLRAAASRGLNPAGVDVSMAWLIVARRLIEEDGYDIPLAAAMAEHLPLADASVDAAVALDVIEHVHDPAVFVRSLDRIVAPGGSLALSTPNRFSLAAEPHVGVWGVGWMPRRWQKSWVRFRSGADYSMTRLLSAPELETVVTRNSGFLPTLTAPAIPGEEIARFKSGRAAAARAYNALVSRRWAAPFFRIFGAFFRVTARKSDVRYGAERTRLH